MENHSLEENVLQNWINSDKNLSVVLVEIQELPISKEEQAEVLIDAILKIYPTFRHNHFTTASILFYKKKPEIITVIIDDEKII